MILLPTLRMVHPSFLLAEAGSASPPGKLGRSGGFERQKAWDLLWGLPANTSVYPWLLSGKHTFVF